MAAPSRHDRLPARLQATFVPPTGPDEPGHVALWGTDDPVAAARALGFDGMPGELTTVLPRTARAWKRVVVDTVPAVLVDLLSAVQSLVALDLAALPAWRTPGASVLSWRQAAMLACEHLAAGHLVPTLDRLAPSAEVLDASARTRHARPPDLDEPSATGPGRPVARWRLAHAGDPRVARIAAAMPVAAHAVERDGATIWTARHLLDAFLDAVADVVARRASDPTHGTGASAEAEFMRALTTADPVLHDGPPDQVPTTLAADLDEWAAPVLAGGALTARLCVRLSTPPAAPDDADAGVDRWPLEYLLQSVHDPSLLVDAVDVWASTGPGVADTHLPDAQEALVRGLGEAARLFAPIDASLSEPRPTALDLTSDQAAALLTEGAAALSWAGLGVQLPAELTRDGQARLKARMKVGSSTSSPSAPSGGPGGFSLDEIGDFRWEVAIDGEPLDPDEFAELARHKRSLVRWKGRWVHVDPDQLDRLAAAIGEGGRLDPATAMAAMLAGEVDDPDLGAVEVVADADAAGLLARLAGADPPDPRTAGIDATLRPYQHRGVAWLQARADLGLGSVLADDMGLGKTLQSIVLMAGRSGSRPHLVVCPASVVGNWEREIGRFAPHLDVLRHHGSGRPDTVDAFPAGGITVTTYGTLRSDADLLTAVDWDVVVLDEAQAFKNPGTRTARSVRALPAAVKVPMTGTPVENRLSELWSIMDVAVPGLLGGVTAFTREVARPIERWGDPDATARLRRLTAPFVLRRTKRDPAIAADLPDKQEQVEPVSLTAEQATLYQAVVDETFGETGEEGARDGGSGEAGTGEGGLGEGMERRGRVLKLLTALKQVCNHPAQYLGQSGPLAGRSGKLVRATDLLAEVVDAGDRALVFTQYRRMGDLLAHHLIEELDLPDVPFLHGATSLRRRDELVDAFQHDDAAAPVLLVSLKAGGTGLNLTRATHVVHYDRWWNPAVEDQATDRAYRIGQHRTVFVHKLSTVGTLEERIAEMLERKRELAEAVVGSGEAWLTELDDEALRDLVRLDASPGAGRSAGAGGSSGAWRSVGHSGGSSGDGRSSGVGAADGEVVG